MRARFEPNSISSPARRWPCSTRGRNRVHSQAFSPTDRSWKVLPRASRKALMQSRQRHKRPTPSQIAVKPTLSVQGPPILPSRVPASSPGHGSRLFVALAGRLVQTRLEDRKVRVSPKLTKWSRDDILSDDCERSQFPATIFSPPGLWRSLSNYRRLFDVVSWLGGGRAAGIFPVIASTGNRCAGRELRWPVDSIA